MLLTHTHTLVCFRSTSRWLSWRAIPRPCSLPQLHAGQPECSRLELKWLMQALCLASHFLPALRHHHLLSSCFHRSGDERSVDGSSTSLSSEMLSPASSARPWCQGSLSVQWEYLIRYYFTSWYLTYHYKRDLMQRKDWGKWAYLVFDVDKEILRFVCIKE